MRELFVVVDKEDNVIGYRTRYDCHRDKNLIHRSIHIIVYNDKGEILLQKRSSAKDTLPGYYTISVGGHVSKGETYEKAAGRESIEEIGVDLKMELVDKYISS